MSSPLPYMQWSKSGSLLGDAWYLSHSTLGFSSPLSFTHCYAYIHFYNTCTFSMYTNLAYILHRRFNDMPANQPVTSASNQMIACLFYLRVPQARQYPWVKGTLPWKPVRYRYGLLKKWWVEGTHFSYLCYALQHDTMWHTTWCIYARCEQLT